MESPRIDIKLELENSRLEAEREIRETKRYEQPLHLQVDKTHLFHQFFS